MRNTIWAVMFLGMLFLILSPIGCTADNSEKPTAEALYMQGQALEQKAAGSTQEGRENFRIARDTYGEALKLHPSPALESRIHAGLANASYWLDDYGTALQEWNTAYPNADDPQTKSFILYRIGLCQQRLGQFAAADQTFGTVQSQFPNTDAAQCARDHQGYKGFTVQLATFASPNTADAEIAKLRKQGANPTKATNAKGNPVVSVGPVQTYVQALDLKNRFAATYPQAVIVP